MIKKCLKIAMILFMILGIAFSISNFMSNGLDADVSSVRAIKGTYVYLAGEFRCMDDGTDCIIRP